MPQRPAITIGNFDGVHCGHQALVHTARQRVGPSGQVVALVFDPHPLVILRPDSTPPRLTTFAQRSRFLIEAGVDEISHLEPTPALLNLEPAAFLADIVDKWRPLAIVEGCDFRFGRNRAGSVDDLRHHDKEFGYETIVVDPVVAHLSDHTEVAISSTTIRWLIARGRVDDAARLLGRPYEIESTVVEGHRRGREFGFPTVNLADNGCLLPADGVYTGDAVLPDGSMRIAAISVGTNPTFDDGSRTCEAHLLDFNGWRDDYGWPLVLRFTHWLRDQVSFSSIEALRDQLHRDVERTRALVTSVPAGATQ